MRNLMRTALLSGALLLAIAGQAQAATTIGETFPPASGSFCTHDGISLQSQSPNDTYAAPVPGVITAWSFYADSFPPTLKLKVGRHTGGDDFQIVGDTPLKVPVPNQLNTYTDVRIPVQAGDVIGNYIEVGGTCSGFDSSYAVHSRHGEVAAGDTATFFAHGSVKLDISARLEADCDSDGFGDETQDPDTSSCDRPAPPAQTAECQGSMSNKAEGTESDDTLLGTPTPDTIFGLLGNDAIDGVDGADCLDGGAGDDILRGGAGNDLEFGGEGKDRVSGQGGLDNLNGSEGDDRLNGGEGKDRLAGGPGKDKLNGSAAKDKIKGNAGADDINAVDAKTDKVNCGGGDDKAVVDPTDQVARKCETVHVVEKG